MRITRKDYDEAKDKLEKLRERMSECQRTVKTWEDAAKIYGKPREGDEIVAYLIEDSGIEAITRRVSDPKAAAAS